MLYETNTHFQEVRYVSDYLCSIVIGIPT